MPADGSVLYSLGSQAHVFLRLTREPTFVSTSQTRFAAKVCERLRRLSSKSLPYVIEVICMFVKGHERKRKGIKTDTPSARWHGCLFNYYPSSLLYPCLSTRP